MRKILVAEDEFINQALLGNMLETQYEVIYASNGQEAMDLIRSHKDDLSLILLDLMMPVMSGLEVLSALKKEEELKQIPVIVLTAERDMEVKSLELGAVDFLPKPYPDTEIVLARIRRTIELSEDRHILNLTERDPLTGLYNREFFYRYADQYDQHHPAKEMDAIIVDIIHFHILNDRFGRAFGDELLRLTGEKLREAVQDQDGIVCRREADTFMVYCPTGQNYQALLDAVISGIEENGITDSHIRFRMGVYTKADKTLEIERRFDRAELAANSIRDSVTKTIEFYSDETREKELLNSRLIDGFRRAIAEEQFTVFFQPKFKIQIDPPVLSSAEALIRWFHPEFGMISPGVFIPLFEENGLVQELDRFVWRKSAEQIRKWKDEFNFSVPVSVNVSRVDLYDPTLTDYLLGLIRDYGLETKELILEITESAYAEDNSELVETINELRKLGFIIEMDDFGSGYSSFNRITVLPFDVLKLDMMFIRSIFASGKDTWLLKVLVEIADYLKVTTVAEGVETEEQCKVMKEIGCDVVQGYYFSKPVPAKDFEPFLLERKAREV